MTFNGAAYSQTQLHLLAASADGMAGDVSEIQTGFEASSGATRAALRDDDYGRRYWQNHGRRMADIGTGLELLADALREQETRIARASRNYKDGEDASTLRTA
ncbi:hypothetical protein GCM10022419_028030 [Nonomuraea rosea]|uniref:WXG100 family type VII secretion target n=1 Tax=Nonomuraea rosea TaxID=638574 RepID=A0ABP6W525_9ACTN